MPPAAVRLLLSTVAAATLLAGCGSSNSSDPNTYAPSPDWRDQVIYFIVTDRFADGDTSNDDQGFSENDPSDPAKFSGGDLTGIDQKLDYIQSLGATAVWVTPPVANQWWDPLTNAGGYDGYRARNFQYLDEHMGTTDIYKTLAIDLHKRGMYLVQDIVTNNTGNFFTYDPSAWDPTDPTKGYTANTQSVPVTQPTQAPFNEDDPTVAQAVTDGIYHWTPVISDASDPTQLLTYQLDDLDDIATESSTVRRIMGASYSFWIRAAGVDAFGVSALQYVEHSFWNEFVHSSDGILVTARVTKKDDFYTFGEPVGLADADAVSYLGSSSAPELRSLVNYPLRDSIWGVLGQGRPTSDLTDRLQSQQHVYPDVNRLATLVDDRDGGRFLAQSTSARAQEAYLLLLTLPGVPVIYYGAEQGLTETRASMFAAGWGSGGTDHFDTSGAMFGLVSGAIALRKAHPALTRGSLTVLADDASGPGLFAFRRDEGGETVVALFNTSDADLSGSAVDTGLAPGTVLKVAFTLGTSDRTDLTVDAAGKVTVDLPGDAAVVCTTP